MPRPTLRRLALVAAAAALVSAPSEARSRRRKERPASAARPAEARPEADASLSIRGAAEWAYHRYLSRPPELAPDKVNQADSRQRVALEAVEAFYDVLMERELLRATKADLARAQRVAAQLLARHQVGGSRADDLAVVAAHVSRMQERHSSRKARLRKVEGRFRDSIGVEAGELAEPSAPVGLLPRSLDAARDQLGKYHPSLALDWSEEELAALHRLLMLELEAAWETLAKLEVQLEDRRAELRIAERAASRARERVLRGDGAAAALVDAETVLARASFDAVRTRFQHEYHVYHLLARLGRLLDGIRVAATLKRRRIPTGAAREKVIPASGFLRAFQSGRGGR